MKIAQIAPLMESCPPQLYGGTERIVSYLTEELVRQGHDVTLFASGDSSTQAQLEPFCETALRLDSSVHDPASYHIVMLESVRARAEKFDVLHFHVDMLHFPVIREFMDRTVTTMHGRLDQEEQRLVHSVFADAPLVSISKDQRSSLPHANWVGTVHHGLPRDRLRFNPRPAGGYLAYLGRISPEKRPDRAVEIATRAGARLKMAAKIDESDRDYWETVVEPMIAAHPDVEFVGEVNEREKQSFLGNATALLFPIDWPEPFGLVMIEAMACGTPVIAFRRGSAPEVVDEGVSGLLVNDVAEAVEGVKRLEEFDRARVRARFEQRFTVERLAFDYVDIYRNLPGVRRSQSDHLPSAATEEDVKVRIRPLISTMGPTKRPYSANG
jgi:glycosyltransferase involved in cell wall biosynthesis